MSLEIKSEETTIENSTAVESSQTPEDKFPRGTVVRFLPQLHYGFIKDRTGRDIYFNVDEVRFVGERGARDLQEGQVVGYDVGWTSHGLHVVKLKICS